MTKQDYTYIQCQHCGHVFQIEQNVPIDKLYITSFCPRCGKYEKGLSCGNSKDDVALYIDINADPRYYTY